MNKSRNSMRKQTNVNKLIVRMFKMKGLRNIVLFEQANGVRVGGVLLTNVTEATKFINHHLSVNS